MSTLKEISSDLYQWSEFSVEKQLNFNGYYLINNGESVIIDPPTLLDSDLQSLKNLIKKNSENPSPYWAEEVIGFDYIFDASPLIINKLRHHCYHLTGESPYTYRNHHNFKLDQFKSKLDLLKSISSEDLFIPISSFLS